MTVPRRQQWEDAHGTVGASACDSLGRLAAATSTGGMLQQAAGRVGDSPIVGCGTYADGHVGISCTGNGEQIIRMTLARLTAYLYQEIGNAQETCNRARAAIRCHRHGRGRHHPGRPPGATRACEEFPEHADLHHHRGWRADQLLTTIGSLNVSTYLN